MVSNFFYFAEGKIAFKREIPQAALSPAFLCVYI
jgi:hypothetical protein